MSGVDDLDVTVLTLAVCAAYLGHGVACYLLGSAVILRSVAARYQRGRR